MKSCEIIDIDSFAHILSTISQVHRVQIICLLANQGELCVCDIIDVLHLKQNLVSHHLNILKELWLLINRREGKKIFYSLEKKVYQDLKSDIKNIFSI